MPSPQELLEAVRVLNLPEDDWKEIERRLTKPEPNAVDFAAVKAIIRNYTLDQVPTQVSQADAEAYLKAEEAAADMAIASLKTVTEDIDTVATALKHDELPQ